MDTQKFIDRIGDAKTRKAHPVVTGVLDYFPDALLAVAAVSKAGNDQHNPGEPLHWAKEKSTDEADSLLRHLIDRGKLDTDGQRHSAKVAWRALALLQREIETERALAKEWADGFSAQLAESNRQPQPSAPTPAAQGGQSLREATELSRQCWSDSLYPDAKEASARPPGWLYKEWAKARAQWDY